MSTRQCGYETQGGRALRRYQTFQMRIIRGGGYTGGGALMVLYSTCTCTLPVISVSLFSMNAVCCCVLNFNLLSVYTNMIYFKSAVLTAVSAAFLVRAYEMVPRYERAYHDMMRPGNSRTVYHVTG